MLEIVAGLVSALLSISRLTLTGPASGGNAMQQRRFFWKLEENGFTDVFLFFVCGWNPVAPTR